MSHYPVVVLVPPDAAEPEKEAGRLLAPYDENDEWFREGSRWDWWTVGGRWTGSLDGYDPASDPANYERCETCSGTGTRPDWPANCTPEWIAECNGCNGCHGKGTRLAYRFHPHEGDVRPLKSIRTEFLPTAVVTPDGQWHEGAQMGWFGASTPTMGENEWGKTVTALYLEYRDAVAVLVDCHV